MIKTCKRITSCGFTLVELLVVIAIVAVLVSLLLPAVNSAREAARRTQCRNNLRQFALGCMLHLDAHGHYPSGGWVWGWGGVPDMGIGLQQPGGWAYSVLPFIEEQAMFDLGTGLSGEAYRRAGALRLSTPIAVMYCPSRRAAQPYEWGQGWVLRPETHYRSDDGRPVALVAKLDYAISLGNAPDTCCPGIEKRDLEAARAPNFEWPELAYDGISYAHSHVSVDHVSDGTSKTYMLGEKFMNSDTYFNGQDLGDNEAAYVSHSSDNYRTVAKRFGAPRQDRPGIVIKQIFGSPHASGFHMAFCDGSVHLINYQLAPDVHVAYGTRNGEEVVAAP